MNFGNEFEVASINASKINIIGGLIVNDARDNVKIGTEAAYFLTTGHDNVVLGNRGGYYLTTGANNVAIGLRSGYRLNTANNNVYLGNNSGYYCMGDDNVLVGTDAGKGLGTDVWRGQYNVAIGNKCLYTGSNSYCTAIGYECGYNMNAGATQNTLIGYRCGYSITSADQCTMLGVEAGRGTTTAVSPIVIDNTNHSLDVFYGVAPGPFAEHALIVANNTYTTATLATQIQTQLNTIPGASFTVTAQTDQIIRIVCNVAAAQYQFRFRTGVNAATSLLTVFTPTDDTPLINAADPPQYYELATKMGRLVCIGYRSGYNCNGYDSVIIGTNAGVGSSTYNATNCVYIGNACASVAGGGNYNTAIGYECGRSMQVTSVDNVLIGYQCGRSITTADSCTLVGDQAGFSTTTGGVNSGRLVCIGYKSGYGSNGDDCVYIGTYAGTTGGGNYNTALGFEAGRDMLATANDNVLIGYQCGRSITTADSCTLVGDQAGFSTTTGSVNSGRLVCIGYQSGYDCNADDCVYIGTYAGTAGGGNYNTAIGFEAGRSMLSSAVDNVLIGYKCGRSITTADSCTLVGDQAGYATTTGAGGGGRLVCIGYKSGYNCNSDDCVYIGTSAGESGGGSFNSAVGFQCGRSLSSGTNNTLFGYNCGLGLTTGTDNVCIGSRAGETASSSAALVCIGFQSGLGTIGSSNVYIGENAGANATTGSFNVGLGASALKGDDLTPFIGWYNCALGFSAGANLQSGYANVSIGVNAGGVNHSQTVMIGHLAGRLASSTNTICIGYQAGRGAAEYTTTEPCIFIGTNSGFGISGGGGANVAIGYECIEASYALQNTVALGSKAGQNLRDLAPIVATVWQTATTYHVGDRVTYNGETYRCFKEHLSAPNFHPGTINFNVSYWEPEEILTTDCVGNHVCIGTNCGQGIGAWSTVRPSVLIGNECAPKLSGTSEGGNVAIGFRCLYNATTRAAVAIGSRAAYNSATGPVGNNDRIARIRTVANDYDLYAARDGNHVCMGNDAGRGTAQWNGFPSVFIGDWAGKNLSGVADANVIIGGRAGVALQTGSRNVAVGGHAANLLQTGSQNVIIGDSAGISIESGDDNVIIGREAGAYYSYNNNPGYSLQSGNRLVLIGSGAHTTASTTDDNQIAIGYQAFATGEWSLALGHNIVAPPHEVLVGMRDDSNAVMTTAYKTYVAWSTVSDARFKTNVSPTTLGLDFIRALDIKQFNVHAADKLSIGVVAQDLVATGATEPFDIVTRDADDLHFVNYNSLHNANIRATQQLADQVDSLVARIAELEARLK